MYSTIWIILFLVCIVGQRERRQSKNIQRFLGDFHNTGVPTPDEFESDEARAILNAAVRVYFKFENINEYADSMIDLPSNFLDERDENSLMKDNNLNDLNKKVGTVLLLK